MKTAHRGDLVLIPQQSSYTMMNGPTVRETTWSVAIVTSVTVTGRVKAAKRPQTCNWPWAFGTPSQCMVASRESFSRPVTEVIAALSRHDFDSPEQAREALLPFKAA